MVVALKTALSSILSIQTSTTSGVIAVEEPSAVSKLNVNLLSCSAETITIHKEDEEMVSLEPGNIFAFVGGNDIPIDTPCHSVFRKIVGKMNDNTYTTEFATFQDVFPESVYHASIADTFIEPMLFDIEKADLTDYYSLSRHRDRDLQTSACLVITIPWRQNERRLQGETGDEQIFFHNGGSSGGGGSSGTGIIFFDLALGAFAGFDGIVSAIVAACLLFPFGVCLIPLCPCLLLLLLFGIPGIVCAAQRRRLSLKQEEVQRMPTIAEESLFPRGHQEWMEVDISGNCLYTDRSIGPEVDPSHCFACNFDDSSCIKNSLQSETFHNEVLELPYHVDTNDKSVISFDFEDSLQDQHYCYSSNTFNKEACDKNFYKSLTETCLYSSNVSTNVSMNDVTFPLSDIAVRQNCHLLSILAYLSVKNFVGGKIYDELQLQQSD